MTKLEFDPVKWLERLLAVNSASSFTSNQKIIIAVGLRDIMKQLGADVPTVR